MHYIFKLNKPRNISNLKHTHWSHPYQLKLNGKKKSHPFQLTEFCFIKVVSWTPSQIDIIKWRNKIIFISLQNRRKIFFCWNMDKRNSLRQIVWSTQWMHSINIDYFLLEEVCNRSWMSSCHVFEIDYSKKELYCAIMRVKKEYLPKIYYPLKSVQIVMIIKISIDLDSIIIFKFIIFNLNHQIYHFKLRGSFFWERERDYCLPNFTFTVAYLFRRIRPWFS